MLSGTSAVRVKPSGGSTASSASAVPAHKAKCKHRPTPAKVNFSVIDSFLAVLTRRVLSYSGCSKTSIRRTREARSPGVIPVRHQVWRQTRHLRVWGRHGMAKIILRYVKRCLTELVTAVSIVCGSGRRHGLWKRKLVKHDDCWKSHAKWYFDQQLKPLPLER